LFRRADLRFVRCAQGVAKFDLYAVLELFLYAKLALALSLPNTPSLEHVLSIARQRLSRTSNFNYRQFTDAILRGLIAEGIVDQSVLPAISYQGSRMHGELEQVLSEAFFLLFHRGYFVPKSDGQNTPLMTDFYVTKSGVDWFKGGEPLPEDSRSYVEYVNKSVPNLDPVIEGYLREALTTFARQAWFASAVMLGAAAEKTIYLLAEALEVAVKDGETKRRLKKRMQERTLPKLFEIVQETLDAAKKTIPYEYGEGTTEHLLSLFEAIRVQRNDAVHPKIGKVSPEGVRLTLAGREPTLKCIKLNVFANFRRRYRAFGCTIFEI